MSAKHFAAGVAGIVLGALLLWQMHAEDRFAKLHDEIEKNHEWSLTWEKTRDLERCTDSICTTTSDGLWQNACSCAVGAQLVWEETDRGQRAVCRCNAKMTPRKP